MPTLENTRYERFCRQRAEGKSKIESYKLAGYRPDYGNAVRLTGNHKVKARTEELMHKTAKRHEISVDSLCDELDTAVEQAIELGQPSVLVSASALKARLAGLDKQHLEISGGSFAKCESFEEIMEMFIGEFGGDWHAALASLDRVRAAVEQHIAANAKQIQGKCD